MTHNAFRVSDLEWCGWRMCHISNHRKTTDRRTMEVTVWQNWYLVSTTETEI